MWLLQYSTSIYGLNIIMWILYKPVYQVFMSFQIKTHRWSVAQYFPEKCSVERPVLSCLHAL